MVDNSKKVSELPIANSVVATDRVMVLHDPAGNASVKTITTNNFTNSLRYANGSSVGVIKIGDNLTINATGHVSSYYPAYANVSVAGIVKVGNNLTINATGYLTANNTGSWTFDGSRADTGGGSHAYIDGQTPGGLILYQDYEVTLIANTAVWNFNEDSTVVFPGIFNLHTKDYTELYTANSGQANKDIDIYTGGFQANGVEVWLKHDNGVYIYTENGQHEWKFGNDGKLTLPITANSDTSIGTTFNNNPPDHTLTFKHNGGVGGGSGGELKFNYGTAEIKVVKDAGSTQSWKFDNEGLLTIPGNIKGGNSSSFYTNTTSDGSDSIFYMNPRNSGFYSENYPVNGNGSYSSIETNINDVNHPYAIIENERHSDGKNVRWTFDDKGDVTLPANGFVIGSVLISNNANIYDDLRRPLINVNALDINADGGTPSTVFGPSDTVFDGGAVTTVFGQYEAALDGGVSFNNRHSATFIDGGGAFNQF